MQNDANHCGSCTHSCSPGTCSEGRCAPWVVAAPPTTNAVAGIACDGTNLVWADNGLKEVLQVPAGGGAGPIVLGSPAVSAYDGIAMANGMVVWTQNYGQPAQLYMATEGSAHSEVVQFNMSTPRGLAIDPTAVLAYFNEPVGNGNYQLYACVLSTNPGDNSPCTTSASYTSTQVGPMAADANSVYWTDFGNGTVWQSKALFPTNSMTAVATKQTGAYPIALDTTYVYWATNGSNFTYAVRRTPKASPTTPEDLVSGQPGGAVALATDGGNVYIVTNPGVIQSLPVGGGTAPVTLHTSSSSSNVVQLVYAAGGLYWADLSNNTIYGLRLP
jgi:hypothetical protein